MTCDQLYIGFDWGYVTNALVGMFTRCTYLKWGPSVKIHQIKHLWGWSLKWVARISTSSQLSTLTHWHMSWNGKSSSKRSAHEKCIIETTIFTVELPHDACWNRLAAALGPLNYNKILQVGLCVYEDVQYLYMWHKIGDLPSTIATYAFEAQVSWRCSPRVERSQDLLEGGCIVWPLCHVLGWSGFVASKMPNGWQCVIYHLHPPAIRTRIIAAYWASC